MIYDLFERTVMEGLGVYGARAGTGPWGRERLTQEIGR